MSNQRRESSVIDDCSEWFKKATAIPMILCAKACRLRARPVQDDAKRSFCGEQHGSAARSTLLLSYAPLPVQMPTSIVHIPVYLTGRRRCVSLLSSRSPSATCTLDAHDTEHTSDSVFTPHLEAQELAAQARCTSSASKNFAEFNKVVMQGECSATEGEFPKIQ